MEEMSSFLRVAQERWYTTGSIFEASLPVEAAGPRKAGLFLRTASPPMRTKAALELKNVLRSPSSAPSDSDRQSLFFFHLGVGEGRVHL